MRQGEELGLRWDMTFFQMIVETRSLEFKRGNGEPSVVRPAQNNFAGIGATGGNVAGDSYPDVATGVRAHLQHVLIYAGERVAAPISERTRKVQDWGILTAWQRGLHGPVTYADLARNWAPSDRSYAASIQSVTRRFYDHFCSLPDPAPQLVLDVRGGRSIAAVAARPPDRAPDRAQDPASDRQRSAGAELAQKAIDRAKRADDATRSALGAAMEPATQPMPVARQDAPPFRLLNAQPIPPAEIKLAAPTSAPARAADRPLVAQPQSQVRSEPAVMLDTDPADEAVKSLVSG